jgi:PAS domain S-box-containing protein
LPSSGEEATHPNTTPGRARKTQIAFAAAVLVLLVVGAISYGAMAVSSESERWVRHTDEVLESLQNLILATERIKSSYVGFALTGKEAYLESYRANRSSAEKELATVRALTADNPWQQQRIPEIERLAAQQIQLAEMIIDLGRTQSLAAAVAAIGTGHGKRITDGLQAVVRDLQNEEHRLRAVRISDATLGVRQTITALILGTALSLLITAAAAWSVNRDSARRGLAEQALRDSDDKYRMLLDGVKDYAIFMLDPGGKFLSWNAGAERITGYKAEEIIGQTTSCFFPAEEVGLGNPKEALRRAAADGRHEEQGLRMRKDGSRFQTSVTLTALRAAAGTLVGFSGISRDLSETTDSGAKYRGLLEAAPDAMVVVNQGGQIVLLNAQAETQFGYHRDELLDQPVTNIIPEGFAERLVADGLRSPAAALAQQIGTGIELTGRRKDGTAFPIELMLSPLDSADGLLVTAAIRNITARKTAELHLAQMEGRYRGLLEAAPDAMVVVNQAGNIVLLNLQAEKQFGYHRDELLGQPVKNLIPEGFAERLVADGLRSAADALAQQIGTGIELIARRKNGTGFPIELMLSPLDSAEGVLVTAAIRDITIRKQAEAHLLLMNRSNEELGQFANIASHDLQEPLRLVASYTQLLAKRYKGKLDADADEFIAFAVDGANRMQRLIQDLLAYSRVGTKSKDLLETSTEHAFQEALLNLRGAIEASGALVTHDPLPTILADEMEVTQLFQNLVGNAIKYQKPGVPKIHVSAARNGGEIWTFSVKDNGLGIDRKYFEKIFGMFQRLHKREEFAGTGIGLAICKKIVERHGGTISVESQPGQGSTFRFALTGSATTS